MSIIAKLTEKKDFSASESKIADYIIENKEEILHLTIRELAKTTYTGASTVMRVIKKIYDGSFSDFKVDLAYELQNMMSKGNNKILFQIKKQFNATQKLSVAISTAFPIRAIIYLNSCPICSLIPSAKI